MTKEMDTTVASRLSFSSSMRRAKTELWASAPSLRGAWILTLIVTTGTTIADEVAVVEMEGEGVSPGADAVVDAVGEFVADARFDDVDDGKGELDASSDGGAPRVIDAVGDFDGVRVPLGVGVFDGDGVWLAVPDGVSEALSPRVKLAVCERVPVRVPLGVPVWLGVPVAE